MKILVKVKGGPHSGNFDHAGIPGHQGGSAPSFSIEPGESFDAYRSRLLHEVVAGNLPIAKAIELENAAKPLPENKQKITVEQAITSYTGNVAVNFGLRHDRELSSNERQIVDRLDEAMQPITEDITLYRGIKPINSKELQEAIYGRSGKMQVGMQWEEKGFASTSESYATSAKFSQNENTGMRGTIWRVHLKKGQRALNLQKHSQFLEYEWLLPRASKFRVTGIDYDEKNEVGILDLEVEE